MNGMELLENAIAKYPNPNIVLISARGTVDNALEAIKLGAVDFLQKPFTPKELRTIVTRVLDKDETDTESEYKTTFNSAIKLARKRQFKEAMTEAKKAIGIDPANPDGFNSLGQLQETSGDFVRSREKKDRAAIIIDPTD